MLEVVKEIYWGLCEGVYITRGKSNRKFKRGDIRITYEKY